MKRIFCLLLMIALLFLTGNPQDTFAIGTRPKKEGGPYATPKASKKPIPPPDVRDMQIATGEIKPITPAESEDKEN